MPTKKIKGRESSRPLTAGVNSSTQMRLGAETKAEIEELRGRLGISSRAAIVRYAVHRVYRETESKAEKTPA